MLLLFIMIGNIPKHTKFHKIFYPNPRHCCLHMLPNSFRVNINFVYCEQYFYSAFKNDIIINPEHTCWIDPVALDQLSNRFGLYTVGVRWIKEKWVMASGIICHGDDNEFDIFTGKWIVKKEASLSERFITNLVKTIRKKLLNILIIKKLVLI